MIIFLYIDHRIAIHKQRDSVIILDITSLVDLSHHSENRVVQSGVWYGRFHDRVEPCAACFSNGGDRDLAKRYRTVPFIRGLPNGLAERICKLVNNTTDQGSKLNGMPKDAKSPDPQIYCRRRCLQMKYIFSGLRKAWEPRYTMNT